MTESQRGRAIHAKVEEARENGNFLEALQFSDEAMLIYQADGDYLGLSEVLSSRQSTFKHLFRSTGDRVFLALEEHAALASVAIAKQSGIPEAMGIPYHNLGKYYFEAEKFDLAADAFAKAVQNLTDHPGRHSRPSVLADIKNHQYVSAYAAGDEEALGKAERALEDLKKAEEENTYNKAVWLSGGHLRIAKVAMSNNPTLAKHHLDEASKIIEADERLILRKEELEEMKQRLSTG